jgi:hypothetical protein
MTAIASAATTIAGVPALLGYRGSPELAMETGTVLLYHGFGGTKERVDYYSAALAEAGFLAVSLDAVGHGERRYPDFDVTFSDQRWDAKFEETEADFLTLIDDTVAEVPSVIDDLLARGWAREDRVGIGGRSLGGNVSTSWWRTWPPQARASWPSARPGSTAKTSTRIRPVIRSA